VALGEINTRDMVFNVAGWTKVTKLFCGKTYTLRRLEDVEPDASRHTFKDGCGWDGEVLLPIIMIYKTLT
jgi:hypothetical protein